MATEQGTKTAVKTAKPKIGATSAKGESVAKAVSKARSKTVTVRQIRSGTGRPLDQNQTLVGLRLNKINRVSTLEDTPAVRGMINKVKHLLRIEE